jgi:hypothetical protein
MVYPKGMKQVGAGGMVITA